jgi:ABC-2 type transport system permease protein
MTGLRLWLHQARALFMAQYAYMTEYRAELILWALSMSLSFILMGVWHEASARADLGISPDAVVRYFFCIFMARQLTVVWVIWDFEAMVLHGRLSSQLLLPIDPVFKLIAGHIAERVARGPFVVLLVGLFFLIAPQARFVPSVVDVMAFSVLSLGAFLLRFMIQYTVAMACFWLERATAIETLNFLAYMFLSGAIAPLETFPPLVRDIAMLTPFPYMLYLPAKALMGDLDALDGGNAIVRGCAVMACWFFAFLVLNRVLWRRGLRRYSSMGA